MPANQRRRHLRDIEPEKVDLVDRAANKRKFIVLKEDAMPDNLGPELEVVSDEELRTASGGINLEKATEALANLTAAVEVLKEQIEKDEPVTDEQMQQAEQAAQAAAEVAEGGSEGTDKADPAAALAAVGEKAMMWAKELAEGGDPEKVAEYAKELMGMLEDLMKPMEGEGEGEGDTPAPPAPPPPRGDQEEKRAPADVLKSVAEAALGLASKIEEDAVISAESVGTIDELIAKVSAITSEAEIAKAEAIELSDDLKNNKELGAIAKGMVGFLRDIASRVGTVASTITEEISDVAKKELGWAQAALEAAKSCVPDHVTKSEDSFQATVQAVAERALCLSRKMAGVDDKRAQKEADQLLGLMSSLVEKYADRKQKGFDLADYNVVIDVDRKLNAIEDVIRKAEEDAKAAAAAEAAPEAKAEGDDDTKPGVEPPKPDEVKPDEGSTETETSKDEEGGEGESQDDKDAQDLSKALMERITALTSRVTELQSFIAKARGTVPSPAADGEPDGEGGDSPSTMLFPMDYNDPAYKVDLDDEGEE